MNYIKTKRNFFLLACLVVLFNQAFATKRTWSSASSTTWSVSANWSGSVAPGVNDTAVFDGTSTVNCTLTANISVKCIQIKSGYTGTLSQSTFVITVGAGGFSVAAGTFTGGSNTINLNGPLSVSGGTFTSTSGTMNVASDFTFSGGTFNHNSGTVSVSSTVSGSASFSGSPTFNNLTFTSGDANSTIVTISSGTLTVNGTLNITGIGTTTINSGNIFAAGNVTLTSGGGTTTITLNGTGSQTLTGSGGSIGNIVINKSSGTLTLSSTINISGNWTWTAGTVSAGSSTVYFTGTPTITGSHTLNTVTLNGAATIANALTLSGNLNIAGTSAYSINTGTINVAGDITVTDTASGGGGSTIININGTGSQALTQSGVNQGNNLPNVIINKSSGTLTLASGKKVWAGGNWTWTAGTITTTSSTVVFTGTSPTIDGNHTLNNVTFAPSGTSTVTVASGKTLTVAGTLTYGGNNGLTINTGSINPTGNVSITNTVTTGGGSATLLFNGTNNQTVTGLSSAGLPLSKVLINKTGGTLTFTNTIAAGSDWTYSATSTTLATTGSTIVFTGTSPTIDGTHTLNNVTFSPASASTVTIASGKTLTVGGTLTYGGTAALTLNTGTINPTSHITVTNTVTTGGGSATINITGSNSQTFTGLSSSGLPLSNIVINKSGGTLTFTNTITAGGNWTWTAGTLATTGSTINFTGTTPTIDGTHTLNNVTFSPASSSTVTIASGKTLTVGGTLTYGGTAALTVNTGTINPTSHITVTNTVTTGGGSAIINITGSNSQTFTGLSSSGLPLSDIVINKSGGTLTFTNTIAAGGNWTWTAGTLATTGSTINFTGTTPTIDGNHTLNNVTFSPASSSTITIASGKTLTVGGTLTYGGTAALTVNTGTVNPTSHITVTNTVTTGGGSAIINITGGNNQTFTGLSSSGLPLSNIVINKSGGTLTFTNTITAGGNWTWTAGTLATSGSTINFTGATPTIDGTHTLNNVTFSPAASSTITIASGKTLTVGGTLTYAGTAALTVNTGTINPTSHITVTNTVTTGGGSATINITGGNNQTFTGLSSSGLPLSNIVINKSGGTLTFTNTIAAGGNWTWTAGTLASSGSTINFTGTSPTIAGSHTLNTINFAPTAASTVTISNALTLNGDLNYNNQNAITVNTGTINVAGNLTVTDTASGGGGNALININGTGTQTVTQSGVLQGNSLPNVTINKSGTLVLANGKNIWMGGNWAYTAAGTLTTTGSTVIFKGTSPTIAGTHTLTNISFSPTAASTVTISNALSVSGLTYNGSSNAITVNTGTINVSGNLTTNNTASGGGGSTLINITGTGTQTLTSSSSGTVTPGPLGPITISKTGGTLTLSNNINAGGDWTYSASSTTLTPGSSSVIFTKTSPTIAGTHTLNAITFAPTAASTVTISNALTLNGDLKYNNQNAITVNTGTINVAGNITVTDTASGGGGSALININGTSTQTVTQSGVLQGNSLPNVTINKTGTLVLANNKNIWVKGNWTYTAAGTLTTTGSTVVFTGTGSTITGNHTLNSLAVLSTSPSTLTIASGNTVSLNGTLSFYGNSTTALNTGTINAGGNISIFNTSTGSAFGNATIVVNGTGAQTLSCSTGAPVIPNLTINKTAGTLTVTGTDIAIGGNLIHTAGTVTVDTSSKISLYGTANINASALTFGSIDVRGVRSLAADLNVYKNLHIVTNKLDASGTAYNINIQGNWTNDATFASGTGYVRFTGTKSQTVYESSGDTIARLKMDKASGNITLNSVVTVTDSLKFIKGNIITTSTNLLALNKRAAVGGAGASTGFVSGPVKKTGNTLFTFPTGKSSNYQPIKISAPASATDAFTGEYFGSGQTLGSTTDTTINNLSTCEYWNLARTTGTSSVSVTAGWNASSCNITSSNKLIEMKVAYWNSGSSKWNDVGGTSLTGNTTSGTITSASAVNNFGYFTLANEAYHALSLYYDKHDIADGEAEDAGYIVVSGQNGLPPYQYKWENDSTGSERYGLVAGTYSLTVVDSLRDTIRQSITIGDLPVVLNSNYIQTVSGTTSYTNTGVGTSQIASLTYANTIDADEDGWFDFKLADTTSSFYLGYQPQEEDTLPPVSGKSGIETVNLYISRASMAGHSALLATYDTLTSSYSDSIRVVCRRMKNGSNVMTTAYGLGFGHNKLFVFIGGKTYQKPITVNPGDQFRIGRSSGAIYASRNGSNLTIESSSIASTVLSPQLYLKGTAATPINLVGQFSHHVVTSLSCTADLLMNYVENITYDENGNITSDAKVYYDYLGRTVQTQASLLTEGNTLVTQNLFDGLGRTVGQTLPAPNFSSSLCYQSNFINDATSGNPYNYNYFDKPVTSSNNPGEVNNPTSVKNSVQGSLGWYYSDNNTSEPFVDKTGIPYSRVEYYPDPLNRPRRTSGVGDSYKMGSGHESIIHYSCSAGELEYFYGYHGTYERKPDWTEYDEKNHNLLLYKTITVNADGREDIAYTNSSGKTIATCISGGTDPCFSQEFVQGIPFKDNGSIFIHLPKISNGTLILKHSYTDCPYPNVPGSSTNMCDIVLSNMASVTYTLTDVNSGHILVQGTDYSINSSTGAVTFSGSYYNTSLYLKVYYDYSLPHTTNRMPKLAAQYQVDYNNWTLNYFDTKGQLIANIAPNDINCTSTLGTISSTYSTAVVNVAHMSSPTAYYDAGNWYYYDKYDCNTHVYSSSIPGYSSGATANASVQLQLVPSIANYGARSSTPPSYNFSRSQSIAGAGRMIDTTIVSLDTAALSQKILYPDLFKNLVIDSTIPFDVYFTSVDSANGFIDTITDASASRLVALNSRIDFAIDYTVSIGGHVYGPFELTCSILPGLNTPNGGSQINVSPPINIPINTAQITTSGVTLYVGPTDIEFSIQGYPGLSGPYGMCGGTSTPPTGVNLTDWFNFQNAFNNDFQLSVSSAIEVLASSAVQSNFSKKYTYDNYGHVVSVETADEGKGDFVYDNEDKLRFSQNDKQRVTSSGGKFTYVNYDRAARPVETGEYDPTISGGTNPYYFRTYAQNAANTNTAPSGHTDIFYDITNNLDAITPNGRTKQQTYTCYDAADGNLNSYVSGYNQKHLASKVSRTWNDYSTSWYSYDELGRLSWTVQQTNEAALGNPYKTYNYTYDMQGHVLETAYNKEDSGEDFYHKFEYDADQRLYKAYTSLDHSTWDVQDKYYYYLHGPLKREEIQNDLQGIDYVYTINGKLKSINHPSLNNNYDPGQDSKSSTAHSGFDNDVFGFALDYYTNDYTRSSTNVQSYSGGTNLFGGTIKSARWQTQNPASTTGLVYTGQQLMYSYEYDDLYRLSTAGFGTYTGSTSSITLTSLTDFKTDNLTYDRNGNIKSLRRKAQNLNWPAPALDMDDLTYNYDGTKTNRLLQVADAESMTPLSPDIDLPNQSSSSNYTYNEIGQVTANAQEGTTTEYDVYGQVSKVYKTSGGNKIARFIYNDIGLRAAKISYNSSGYKQKQVNYMYDASGSLIATYETTFNTTTPDSTNYTVSNSSKPMDYVVYGASRLGIYDNVNSINNYEFTDHLGNVRAVYQKNLSTGNADVISFTDYYPHGGAMPGRNYVSSPNYRYAYNGQEKDAETGLLNFELRQFDARLGRWFAPDPMHQMHTPYAAMGNNPISMVDPTGGEYDEVKAYGANAAKFNWGHDGGVTYEVDGMIVSEFAYNNIVGSGGGKNVQKMTYGGLAVGTTLGYSYGGKNYYGSHGYANASAAQEKQLAGMPDYKTTTYTAYNDYPEYGHASTSSGSLGFDVNTVSLKDAIRSGNAPNDRVMSNEAWLVSAGYTEIAIGAVQRGMQNYRKTINVGTFGNYNGAYKALGTTGKILGAAGYLSAGLNEYSDYKEWESGEIGGGRFGYRTVGTLGSLGGSIGVGAAYGGPWGAVAGGVISGVSWAGEKFYDGYNYAKTQMSIFLTNLENGLQNGWGGTGR